MAATRIGKIRRRTASSAILKRVNLTGELHRDCRSFYLPRWAHDEVGRAAVCRNLNRERAGIIMVRYNMRVCRLPSNLRRSATRRVSAKGCSRA
jgi:hypothetical protein